jgi:hypothetical protein
VTSGTSAAGAVFSMQQRPRLPLLPLGCPKVTLLPPLGPLGSPVTTVEGTLGQWSRCLCRSHGTIGERGKSSSGNGVYLQPQPGPGVLRTWGWREHSALFPTEKDKHGCCSPLGTILLTPWHTCLKGVLREPRRTMGQGVLVSTLYRWDSPPGLVQALPYPPRPASEPGVLHTRRHPQGTESMCSHWPREGSFGNILKEAKLAWPESLTVFRVAWGSWTNQNMTVWAGRWTKAWISARKQSQPTLVAQAECAQCGT